MSNDDGNQRFHAERRTLHVCLMRKNGRDHDGCWYPGLLERDGVVRTARRARPSITNSRQRNIVFGRDPRYQLRLGIDGKAFLFVARHRSERRIFGKRRHRSLEEFPTVPLRVIEYADAQSRNTRCARRDIALLDFDDPARIVWMKCLRLRNDRAPS